MDQTNKIQQEKEDGLINGISSISLEDPSSHQMQNIDQFKEPRSAPAIKSFLDVNLNTNSPSNRPTSSSSLDSGLTTSSFNNNKNRINRKVGRFQRVESSWEDVPSSSSSNEGEDDDEDDDDEEEDDSDTKTIKMRMQQIRAERSSESTPKRNSLSILLDHEDQWEDEDAIMAESDSGGSQITEITTTKNKNHSRNQSFSTTSATGIIPPQSSSSASEDDGIRGTPQGGRSSRLPRRSSAQRALREYRKSRLALMQSESDNIGRYNKIMRGELVESEEDQESKNELRRADTMDMLDNMEPFTAGIGTESVDDADTSARAYDIRLRENNNNNRLKISTSSDTPSRTSNLQKRNSQLPPLRSPRLPPRRLSTSPSIKVIPLKQSDPMIEEQQNSFSEDQYASVPASPADNTAMTNEWLSTVDGTRDTVLNGMKKPSPKIKSETLPNIESQTPRRHSRSNENINVHQNTSNLNGKANLISAQLDQLADATPPFSLWDYLKEEIMASDFDSTQEMKWERVTNFIAIPFWMEKIMLFGFFVCLDSFLYTFTILPIRFLVAIYFGFHNFIVWITGGQRRYLSSSHKCDILKTLLIISSCWILSRITDASKMYHSVRGQDVVKLYVIFNVLEIADRLCCSFGQDLLDSLFSRSTLARRKDGHQPYLRPLGFFALSLLYVLAHTLVLLYQLVTLNVAINSYDNALLTLLLSNQFVEIKGSVFKKFEKENLFQLTCADIVERFQLTLMLCSIGLRNLIEVAGAAGNSIAALTPTNLVDEVIEQTITTSTENLNKSKLSSPLSAIAMLGGLPASFSIFPSFSLLETIFTPVCIVLASEFLVDWLKHAFITKFNHIRPSVYGRFMDVLCRDLVMAGPVVRSSSSKRRHTFVDQSPVVSRRLGFASVPLACLLVRMTSQVMEMLHDDSHFDECAVPDWQKHSTNNITDGSGFPLEESISDFIWRMLRRPFELILSILFNNPKAILDNALHYAVSMAAWTLTIIIAWFFLVALKLILGTNLVSFASNRYSTMGQREKEEELNSRDRQPIGVDKEEMDYNSKLSQLIDKKDDDASRMGFAGQPLPTPAKYGGGGGGGKNKGTESLMDVSRYTMVRSRIW